MCLWNIYFTVWFQTLSQAVLYKQFKSDYFVFVLIFPQLLGSKRQRSQLHQRVSVPTQSSAFPTVRPPYIVKVKKKVFSNLFCCLTHGQCGNNTFQLEFVRKRKCKVILFLLCVLSEVIPSDQSELSRQSSADGPPPPSSGKDVEMHTNQNMTTVNSPC